jgi:hypothetical protein
MPPAFSQSGCVLKVDRSIPDGLAEGAPEVPVDGVEPGVLVAGSLLVEPPVVPEGLLVPGLLPPLPVWAEARTGVRAMVPTRSANTNFFM